MNSSLLFSIALFCACAVGGCQGAQYIVRTTASTANYSTSEENTTIWLNEQQFITRIGLSVDINLPRINRTVKCTFITPDNRAINVEENNMVGVTTYGSSDYVSCRIVVGPMEQSLIGNWAVCGAYTEDNVEHKRCQSANIAWRNSANPDTMWPTTIQPTFNHVVYFRGILSPGVRGFGKVVSCHLVTPNNEDLFVTRESKYPNIKLVQDTDSVCSIAIGPIAKSHLGSWAIYGKFNSVLRGFNEVRLPMNLDLYNKNHPYEQAYNVTNFNATQHVVNIGSKVAVKVASTGAVVVCLFTMPSGMSYNTFDHGPRPRPGVSFVIDNRIACRLSIGPITQDMIGPWLLIGRFSNHGVFTEIRQRFDIIQEDPRNPVQEEDRLVEYLPDQLIYTDIGANERVAITQPLLNTVQSCHIRTPEGLQYTFMEGINVFGIEIVTGSNIQCGVNVKVSEDVIGDWMLIAREIRNSERIERRLPFKIIVKGSQDWRLNMTSTPSPSSTTTRPYSSNGSKNNAPIRQSEPLPDRVMVEMPGLLAADQDLHFALSLVPMLRQRNPREKLSMQVDLVNYFRSKLRHDRL